MREIETPVLIVGAGGCGLSASVFLADLGVESLLIERHPATAHLPKAHYLNQRTMEIFRQHNVADSIYAKSAKPEQMGRIYWYSSLGGDGPIDAKRFVELDGLGGGEYKKEYDLKGVTHPTSIPQLYLEPIIREAAEARNPGRVLFRHDFQSLTQDANGVTAIVRDLDAGEDFCVRAQYLVAADGGKTVGPHLGLTMVGDTNLADMVTIHIEADLSKYITEDDSVLRMIVHPALTPGAGIHTGGILTYGPKNWDRHSEEWGVTFGLAPGDPAAKDETGLEGKLKDFLKIDVPVKIIRTSLWQLESVITDRMIVGRVILAGDAAHKHTPFAGLGLNSAVQDAHNLCWKLALVLQGVAPTSLINAYEAERRPVVEGNAAWSLFTFNNHNILVSSLGLIAGAPDAYNEAEFAKLIADTPGGAARRARMQEVFKLSRIEYGVHDLEMGFNYPQGAVIDDGSPPPARHPLGWVYTPTTRPGGRLPHVWLRSGGERVSTHDFLPLGGFLLLTDAHGSDWIAAAQKVAADTGVTLRALRIGERGADASDPSGDWAKVCGFGEGGAILVRPDAHVAWRTQGRAGDAHAALGDALRRVLQARL